MRLTSLLPLTLLCVCTVASAATHHPAKKSTATKHSSAKSTGKRPTSSSHTSAHGKGRKRASTKSVSHAAPMDSERATTIQTALIKRGYLSGEPTGKWDAASISAMQKLQSDNGWQSKVVPDARGLIKLGLGPQPETPAKPQPETPAKPQP